MPVNDLAVNVKGDLYFTDTANKKIWLLPKGGTPRVVDEGIEYPNGVLFSPDQTLLYVSDYVGQLSWVFQIQPDGSLAHKQRYFYVHMPDAATRSSSDGMAVDANGRVYIATALGVQVFDQIGKCHAIIPAPQRLALSNVEFGGPNFDEMYVTNGDKVFKRKTKVKGVMSWRAAHQAAAAEAVATGARSPWPGCGSALLAARLGPARLGAVCRAQRNKTLVCIANYCHPRHGI